MNTKAMNGTAPQAKDAVADAVGNLAIGQVLEFKFNQLELRSLTKLADKNMISVTICSFSEHGGPKKMYLCAIAHKEQTTVNLAPEVNTDIRPIVGCPFPPAWKLEDSLAVIPHSSIADTPKFYIAAATVLNELPNNTHAPLDPADPTISVKQVSVALEAGVSTSTNELETFVTFTMKDASGSPVGSPLKAISL